MVLLAEEETTTILEVSFLILYSDIFVWRWLGEMPNMKLEGKALDCALELRCAFLQWRIRQKLGILTFEINLRPSSISENLGFKGKFEIISKKSFSENQA